MLEVVEKRVTNHRPLASEVNAEPMEPPFSLLQEYVFFDQVSTNDRSRFDVFGGPTSAEVVSPQHHIDFDDDDDDDDNRRSVRLKWVDLGLGWLLQGYMRQLSRVLG